MKIYNLKCLLFFLAGLFVMASCKEDFGYRESVASNPAVPQVIKDPQVENLAGKAKISYTLPADPNLLYVKAVYTLASGKSMEVKATYYDNSLIIEGFADTNERIVKLYSVSRSEVVSEPVTVTIKPLEAPIWNVFKSISVANAFGGYNLTANNPSSAAISILVLKKNEFGEYVIDNNKSIYTSVDKISSKIRGLDTLNRIYPIYVQDRWGNRTDTLFQSVKAIYEQELPQSAFRVYPLPGDATAVGSGEVFRMWDGKLGWPNTSFTNQSFGPQSHIITFDAGKLARLSRVWIRPYPEGTRWYFLTTMKRFEIWGSASPNLNGAMDNTWVLLGSYTVVKPSGLPYGTDSAEDQTTAAKGFDWELDITAPKVRYLRIKCLENFVGGTAQSINEIKVYGDPRN